MIPSSATGRMLAAGLALAAHGALALALVPPGKIDIAGSAGSVEARLGASFADMAAGMLTALQTEKTVAAVQPPPAPLPLPVAPPAAMVPAPAPDLLAPLPAMTVRAPDPGRVESPPAEAAKRPAPRPEPRPEPARIEAEPERDPEETPRKAARATPRGNADRDARAGQETGREQAKAATSGLGGTTGETGNAAVSNYPGLVMRKLARVPRPRLAARGATVVAFRIADNGRLATASVAQSSGAAALDHAALRLVQRAAPFPPPPSGAQRSFSIRIEGR